MIAGAHTNVCASASHYRRDQKQRRTWFNCKTPNLPFPFPLG